MLDQHHYSVGNIDQVEQCHEDKGCQLKIMNLTSQSTDPVDPVVDAYTHDHGYYDQVDGLCDEAFVHDWDDVGCLGVVLFDEDHVEEYVPDQSVEEVDGDDGHDSEPIGTVDQEGDCQGKGYQHEVDHPNSKNPEPRNWILAVFPEDIGGLGRSIDFDGLPL